MNPFHRIVKRFRPAALPPHLRLGIQGEALASKHLKTRGYRIIGERVRVGKKDEIDLIARDEDTLVFVEVKTRRDETYGRPLDGVTKAKIHHLSRAAIRYMGKLKKKPAYFRFDVIEVILPEEGEPELRHHEGAFTLDPRFRANWM